MDLENRNDLDFDKLGVWPNINIPILKNRGIQHFLYWVSMILISSINWWAYNVSFLTEIVYNLFLILICISIVYFNFYFLIPKYLLKRRIFVFACCFFFSIFIGTFILRVLLFYAMPFLFPEVKNFSFATKSLLNVQYFTFYYASLIPIIAFSFLIKLGKMWYQKELTSRLLRQEKLDAELKFLKNQINPHFFFNTLNNLYALTLKKSDAAPEVVMGLSSLMDYLLHESNVPFISLEKEIKILKDYNSLEKIRHDKSFNISFHITGDSSEYKVAPLLFLPFVENAFKHGNSEGEELSWVNIEIELEGNYIIFKVENSKPSIAISSVHTSGIGLQNVQKRLDILYKDRHSLQFFDEADTFLVVLKIEIALEH